MKAKKINRDLLDSYYERGYAAGREKEEGSFSAWSFNVGFAAAIVIIWLMIQIFQ